MKRGGYLDEGRVLLAKTERRFPIISRLAMDFQPDCCSARISGARSMEEPRMIAPTGLSKAFVSIVGSDSDAGRRLGLPCGVSRLPDNQSRGFDSVSNRSVAS